MAWFAVDKNKSEWLFASKPFRWIDYDGWGTKDEPYYELPKGAIKRLIGRELTWKDEPVELEEE